MVDSVDSVLTVDDKVDCVAELVALVTVGVEDVVEMVVLDSVVLCDSVIGSEIVINTRQT